MQTNQQPVQYVPANLPPQRPRRGCGCMSVGILGLIALMLLVGVGGAGVFVGVGVGVSVGRAIQPASGVDILIEAGLLETLSAM